MDRYPYYTTVICGFIFIRADGKADTASAVYIIMESIQYKFELFEGPLELLLTLVEKNKFKIDDIPIDVICSQYMDYINAAAKHNIELACEFLSMASELMLIKSRMLLPRNPKIDDDPRKPLIDAMLEYQRAKLAAAEMADMYLEFGSRMIKEQDDISPDKTYVADHSAELLRAALIHVLTETNLSDKKIGNEFEEIVNAPRIPLETIMTNLIGSLRSSKKLYLDQFFIASSNHSERIAKFIAILELLKMHIISVDDDSDSESGVTNMASHIQITLIASDEEIEAAAIESYQFN